MRADRPLDRGFARVTDADGAIVRAGASLTSGKRISIRFGDRVSREAVVDGAPETPVRSVRPRPKAVPPPQGELF